MRLSKAPESSNLKVTVFWGDVLYDVIVCRPQEKVTIGRRPDNTFVFDTDKFTLVDVDPGNRADLHFSDKCDGHIRVGEELFSLKAALQTKHVRKGDDGLHHVILNKPDKADVVLGHVTFSLDWVEHAHVLPTLPVMEKQHYAWVLLTALVLLGAVFMPYLVPESEPEKEPENLVLIEPPSKPRVSPVQKAAEQPTLAATSPVKPKDDGGATKEEAGKAATAPEPPPPQPVEKPSAAAALRKADLGNLVGGLTNLGSETPSAVPSANVAKAPVAEAGTGGFTAEGIKKGASGKSVGIGKTVGQGEGGFASNSKIGLSGTSPVAAAPDPGGSGGQPRVAGGLERGVIESVIRRRWVRIRLCYERQLNFNPALSGKVTVRFTIGKTGSVVNSQITENTMKNPQVDQCIQQEVLTWSFPPPEGGTLVNVDYPFIFESSVKQ